MRPDIETLLDPGERLLWSGSSSEDRLLMRIDYLLVPLGILLFIIGFVAFFVGLRDSLEQDTFLWERMLLSVLFLGFGWDFTLWHFVRRRRDAKRAAFAVTDRRAIQSVRLRHGKTWTESAEFVDHPRVKVKPQYEGRATISVGPVTFFNIPEYEQVETLVRQQV